MNKKLWIGVALFFIITAAIAFVPTEKSSESDKQQSKQQQQQDFSKIYEDFEDTVYNSRKAFYFSNNLLTLAPRNSLYSMFKDSEELYRKCSVYYTLSISSVPESLKDYKEDIGQSYSEIGQFCVILQDYSKYMADFINTNNLESSRKARKALDQEPFKIMNNAVSRLVYGVGDKIGVDTEKLSEEYKGITTKVEQEFADKFNKTDK